MDTTGRYRDEALRRRQAEEAHQLTKQGWTYARIAKKLGISKSQVGKDLAWLNGTGWLADKRKADRRELRKRALALRVERDLTQKEIGDELGVSRSEARRLLEEAKAPPRRMIGRQKYPNPEPRPCAYPGCEKPATVRWPSSVVYGRGVYCGTEHRDEAHAEQLRLRRAAIRELVARLKLERDALETSEVARLLGVTAVVVTNYYVELGLSVERHVIKNETVLLFPRDQAEAFRRAWVRGGLKALSGRRARWFDPDFVVACYRARGLLRQLVEEKGLSDEEEAGALVRARVKRRRKELLRYAGGHPSGKGPPDYHFEWARALVERLEELEREHEQLVELELAKTDDRPTKWQAALSVAEDDFHAHRDRWDGYPGSPSDPSSLHPDYARAAADRVRNAVKRLQIARTETLAA
jgi:predicted transcriptional regulator